VFECYIDDNYHYQDESHRTRGPSFGSYDAAVRWAQGIVHGSLCDMWEPGMSPEELMARYRMFGDDPWIKPVPTGERPWSGRDYAASMAESVCRHSGKLPGVE
jgi:hypothetical protein